MNTQECVKTLVGHHRCINCLSYDNNLLASACTSVKIWNLLEIESRFTLGKTDYPKRKHQSERKVCHHVLVVTLAGSTQSKLAVALPLRFCPSPLMVAPCSSKHVVVSLLIRTVDLDMSSQLLVSSSSAHSGSMARFFMSFSSLTQYSMTKSQLLTFHPPPCISAWNAAPTLTSGFS